MSPPLNAAVPADAAARQYLAFAQFEKRLAARTLALYTADLVRLERFASEAGVGLTAVLPHHIRRWVAHMHAQGRSPRGIALILSGWRGFYVWAGRQGLVPVNPVLGVRAPKASRPLPKALGVDEAVQLAAYEGADDPWREVRDRAMVELLYGCGLRVGELVGLDRHPGPAARGWVDEGAALVHVLGKGERRRTVPVGAAALQAWRAWCAVRDTAGAAAAVAPALFISHYGSRLTPQAVWQRVRRRSTVAGLAAPVHPHMLRHSFASHVLQSSGDLRGVQELLGHANIATTQIYTRLDFQHLSRVYDAAHPRAGRSGKDPK